MKSKEKVERTLSCFLRRLRHGRTGGTEGLPLSDVAANERGDGGVGGGTCVLTPAVPHVPTCGKGKESGQREEATHKPTRHHFRPRVLTFSQDPWPRYQRQENIKDGLLFSEAAAA